MFDSVWANGCTHYPLTQHWMNLRVLAEGTLDIDANGNARLTAVSLTQQARGETRCGRTTGRQWHRMVSVQHSSNTPCWLRTRDARFWLADVPTTDSHTSWTPTDSPLTDMSLPLICWLLVHLYLRQSRCIALPPRCGCGSNNHLFMLSDCHSLECLLWK